MSACSCCFFIAEYDPPFEDGRVVRIRAAAEILSKRGIEVWLISYGPEDSNWIDQSGVNRITIGYPGLGAVYQGASKGGVFSRFVFEVTKWVSRKIPPDRYVFGLIRAYRAMVRASDKSDVIILSVPVYSPLLLLPLISRRFGRVIVDYRDLWSNNPIFVRRIFMGIVSAVESSLLRYVDLLLVTTEAAQDYMRSRHENVFLIRNGISDSASSYYPKFNTPSSSSRSWPANKIGYFGNLGNKRRCDGFIRDLVRYGYQVHLKGNIDHRHASISGTVISALERDRERYFQALYDNDYLLLVITENENSQFAIPGKTYEYVSTGIPIIVLCDANAAVLKFLESIQYPHVHFLADASHSEASFIFQISKCEGRNFFRSHDIEALFYEIQKDSSFSYKVDD